MTEVPKKKRKKKEKKGEKEKRGNSDRGNRTPGCRVRDGDVNHYTISDCGISFGFSVF